MEKRCRNCKYYSEGLTEEQRYKWDWSNLGRWATGVCNLYFPRGYICRTSPHPTISSCRCFQWEDASTELDQIQLSL